MAKPPVGKCVHCLNDPVPRDWDHVFPESWYPDETPANLEKWKAPSCIPCNRRYGRIEADFLSRVCLSLEPDHPASRSVIETAMRSMKPAAARDDRDRRHRAARRDRILADVLQGQQIPEGGTIPGMGERWARPLEEQVAILVPADSVEQITEKIVRGIFFVEDGKFIEPPYGIELHVLDDEVARVWRALLDRHSITYTREPGVVVRRAVAPEDSTSALLEILLWQQFRTFASVTKD